MFVGQGRKRLHEVTKIMRMTGKWTWTELTLYEHSVVHRVDYEYFPDGNIYVTLSKRSNVRTFYECFHEMITDNQNGWMLV